MLVIGNYASPYVRKVLIALALKQVSYQIDPLVPFFGTAEFARLSPLRRVPVVVDGDLVLNDSSVICEYLEETIPAPPLLPQSPRDRAHARWIEEYCDSRMGDVFIWKLFHQRVIGPGVFGRPTKEDLVREALDEDIPDIMDWLEVQAPEEGFLFGAGPMLADITPACFLRNGKMAGWTPDAERWPRAAGWVERVLALPEFRANVSFEKIILTTRVRDQRHRLQEAGAPLSDKSYAGEALTKSLMGVDRD